MDNKEIKKRQRAEEDYYDEKKWELPRNDSEAKRRYEQYGCKDPFIMIEAALLNSADIFQYVAKTGMIHPFHADKLKGASYEVALRGTVIWWDENMKEPHEEQLVKPEDSFQLKPNSIAFVTLEPMFRIPEYMALRFNLKIVHVYKGLLLGTGPLVDPGFVGHLSIPLHNLTANTYTFHAGDGIIQMEFTKLSGNNAWLTKKSNLQYLYKRNWIKPRRTLKEYIERALVGSNDNVVKSSIPNELSKVIEQSKKIQTYADQFNETIKNEMETFKKNSKEESEHIAKETKEQIENLKDNIEKRLNRAQFINVATVISFAILVVSIMVYAFNTISQLRDVNLIKQETIYDIQKQCEQLTQDYNSMWDDLTNQITDLENRLEPRK